MKLFSIISIMVAAAHKRNMSSCNCCCLSVFVFFPFSECVATMLRFSLERKSAPAVGCRPSSSRPGGHSHLPLIRYECLMKRNDLRVFKYVIHLSHWATHTKLVIPQRHMGHWSSFSAICGSKAQTLPTSHILALKEDGNCSLLGENLSNLSEARTLSF